MPKCPNAQILRPNLPLGSKTAGPVNRRLCSYSIKKGRVEQVVLGERRRKGTCLTNCYPCGVDLQNPLNNALSVQPFYLAVLLNPDHEDNVEVLRPLQLERTSRAVRKRKKEEEKKKKRALKFKEVGNTA